jgi:exosortase A
LSIFSSSANVCTAEPALEEQRHVAALWARPLIALAIAGLITTILLRSTVFSMLKIWYGSNTYSYGFVVVPITAFLVWRRRNELKTLCPATSFWGLALLLLFAVLWAVGNVADVQVIQQFAFVGMLDALVWTFLGNSAVRVLRFALLFLFFAVPAGQGLVGPLQRLTAAFAVNAVRLTGVPAVLNGFVISTPSGEWRIAEACSGIRYLTSSVLLGVLFAGIAFRSWKRRITLIALSAVVPIVANALRAYLIILLAYFSNNRIAAGVDHVMYGWVFFSLVTAVMIGLALGWRELPMVPAEHGVMANSQPPSPAGVARLSWWVGMAVLTVLAASSTADYLWSRTPPNQATEEIWSAPAGWVASEEPDHDWAPHFEDVESETAQTFTTDGHEVSVYVLSYPGKRRGVSLVNSSNAVDVSGDWEVLDYDYRQVTVAGGPMTVAEYLVARGRQRRLVWMWYLAGNQLTSKPYRIKMIQAESRLAGHPKNVALFAISAAFASKPVEAAENLSSFVRNLSFPGLGNGTP